VIVVTHKQLVNTFTDINTTTPESSTWWIVFRPLVGAVLTFEKTELTFGNLFQDSGVGGVAPPASPRASVSAARHSPPPPPAYPAGILRPRSTLYVTTSKVEMTFDWSIKSHLNGK